MVRVVQADDSRGSCTSILHLLLCWLENRHEHGQYASLQGILKVPPRVLWSEGMLLTPHHLQFDDEQRDVDLWGKMQALNGPCVGVSALEFDAAELTAGHVVLKRFAALFPDGTWVEAPTLDLLPPGRTLSSAGVDQLLAVSVGIHEGHAAREGNEGGTSAPSRFSVEGWKVEDRTGDSRSRKIDVIRPVLRIFLGVEPTDGHVTLKVAELARDGMGRWQSSQRYIPQVLRIDASPLLRKLLEDVLLSLVSARRALVERRGTIAPQELTYADMLLFWYIYSLNGTIAGLEHVLDLATAQPDRAYEHLRVCAGHLSTFGEGIAPMDLPPLRRDDLFGSFSKLSDVLRRLLETMLPVHYVKLPMKKTGQHYWRVEIPSDLPLDKADPVLILSGPVPEGTNEAELREALKVASAKDIEFIVSAALRGVELQLLTRAPVGVAAHRDALFLRLRKVAPFWEPLLQSRELALYLPGRLVALTPELVIIP